MNTRAFIVGAAKAFLTLLLTMPFFIKLISNRGGDPSPHCKEEHETHVKNPDEEYQGNYK